VVVVLLLLLLLLLLLMMMLRYFGQEAIEDSRLLRICGDSVVVSVLGLASVLFLAELLVLVAVYRC